MSTTKITAIEDKIRQLENQRKQEIQKLKEAERKARTKRLCNRHGLLESMLPDTIRLTDEQYTAFLKKTLGGDFAKKILRGIAPQGDVSAAPS